MKAALSRVHPLFFEIMIMRCPLRFLRQFFSITISTIIFGMVLVRFVDAHDFWIEPSEFRPRSESLIKIPLLVGNPFRGEPVVRDPMQIKNFIVVNASGEKPVLGVDDKDPAGFLRLQNPGLHIIGYRSNGQKNILEAKDFENYLKQYGLEKIIDLRARQGENQKPGREFFSRCAKSIIMLPGKNPQDIGPAHPLGFTLELIPEKNPYEIT